MRIDPLLEQYPVRIREVTLGVILGISILFYIFPRFLGEAKKVITTIQQEIETFDIPQTEQIKLPEPPPRPLAMNTKSAPETIRLIISRPASAHRRPVEGSPPAPSPRVI